MENFPNLNKKTVELKTNQEGKKYEYEKNGHFYGGDYLNEPPEELYIDINSSSNTETVVTNPEDLPPPPTEVHQVL